MEFKELYRKLISNTKNGYKTLKEGQVALIEETCTHYRGPKIDDSYNVQKFWIGFALKDNKEMAVIADVTQKPYGKNINIVHYKIYLKTFNEAMNILWAYKKITMKNPFRAVLSVLSEDLQDGFNDIMDMKDVVDKEYTIKFPLLKDCQTVEQWTKETEILQKSQPFTWTIFETI